MADVKIKLDFAAMAALTKPLVEQSVEKIATAAGTGFVGDVRIGKKGRPVGVVRADSYQARRRNAKENTLLKSMGAGSV